MNSNQQTVPGRRASFLARTAVRLGAAAVLAGLAPGSQAAETAAATPSPNGATSVAEEPVKGVDDHLLDTFKNGKFNLNVRLRWEHADQEGLDASDAVTVRPRFGFTTAPLYGFQGMIEGENVTSLGAPYNPAGLDPNEAGRTVIADPETTEINQAWLSYSRWDSMVRGGRQRIVLDDHRFVGDVDWRQNQQTYDGAVFSSEFIKRTTVFYAYLDRVDKVSGSAHPLGRFESDSHLVDLSYNACDAAHLGAYAYLLDFDNAPANSSHTFGGRLTGKWKPHEDWALSYRGEFAWQTGAGNNPVDYSAPFYRVDVQANRNPILFGVGYETLGSDSGRFGFQTPLATLHKFNGWADMFLVTPTAGLRDLNGRIGVTLPYATPLQFVYHHFWSDNGDMDFGQEYDAVISHKFGKYFTTLAKVAWYEGESGYPDKLVFWLEADFKY
ncbi:MAG: alginate export family protein [Verrucomicrobiales bacterium]|nr:alginate export family protein [Verrucomicrobiales bacterium]